LALHRGGTVKKQQLHAMHEHAARLSARATSVREKGNIEIAENLTRRAMQIVERVGQGEICGDHRDPGACLLQRQELDAARHTAAPIHPLSNEWEGQMKNSRCHQCGGKLPLGVRFHNRFTIFGWIHMRFCSAYCEALNELAYRAQLEIRRWHAFLGR
jgi:hypothetical protein